MQATKEQALKIYEETIKRMPPFEDGFFVIDVSSETDQDTCWNLFQAGFEVWRCHELIFAPPGGSHARARSGIPL